MLHGNRSSIRGAGRLGRWGVALFLVAWGLPTAAKAQQDGWEILSTPPRQLEGEGLLGQTVAGQALAPIPVSVLAVPLPAESGDPYVSVVVEMGGARMLQGTEGSELQGAIEVWAQNSEGVRQDGIRQTFLLDLDAETRSRLEATGLKLFGSLRLPPGEYRLRTKVVAGELGAQGEHDLSLAVPDLPGASLSLSPPLVPHGLDSWRAFQQSEGGYPELGYPFVAPGGAAFMPSTRPVVGKGPPLDLYLLTHGPEALDGLRARIVDSQGRTLAEPRVDIEAREPGARPSEERILARIETADLPLGAHSLELTGAGARTSLLIEVVPPAEAARADDLLVEPEPKEEVAELEPIDPREVAVLEERYAEIVAGLSSERFEESAEALAAFEGAVLRSDSMKRSRGLRTLRKAQTDLAEELAEESPESLWPLIYLHFLVDDVYQRGSASWPVAHNRLFVMDLVTMYTRRRGTTAARKGANLLAALGVPGAALELDPDNTLALLRLALGREKAGHYHSALPLFEKMVAIDPSDPHGRLRLAINLRRVGQADRARALLRDVAASDAPEWMRLVAYQELVDQEVENGTLARAEAILRGAMETLDDQSLLLRLSFVLDQQRRRDEAIAVMNRLSADRTSDEPSARHRYNGQPLDEIQRARSELLADARAALPSFRAAVGATTLSRVESSP